jgi:hypothetical protein
MHSRAYPGPARYVRRFIASAGIPEENIIFPWALKPAMPGCVDGTFVDIGN